MIYYYKIKLHFGILYNYSLKILKGNKKMYNKYFKYIILLLGTILFSMGIFVYSQVKYQNWVDQNNNQQIKNKVIQISIRDNYTGLNNKLSIKEFFNTENSLIKLKNIYQELNNNKYFNYIEMIQQVFEYKGYCDFNTQLIDGENKEYLNQFVDDEYLTPLKSVQISNKVYNDYDLSNKIASGKGFNDIDYNIDDTMKVNVILGNNYSDIFKVGDEFNVNYLVYGNLTCEVIGFFKNGTQINYQTEAINLDNYIIAPAINYTKLNSENKEFQKILYSVKSTCYIECVYQNIEQYNLVLKEIEKCFSKADIDYRYESNIINLKNRINISTGISWVIGLLGLTIGCFCLFIYVKLSIIPISKELDSKFKISNTLYLLIFLNINGVISFIILYLSLLCINLQNYFNTARSAIVIYCIIAFVLIKIIQYIRGQKSTN